MQIFKLHFTSPLHLAKGKIDYDTSNTILHSDTLKSALAVCAMQLGLIKDVKEFLESFQISSAFPFYRDEFFFPKPNFLDAEKETESRLQIEDLETAQQRKKVKKIQFIGKKYFEGILEKAIKFPEKHTSGGFLSEIFEKDKDVKIFKSEVQERVQIPPIVDSDNPTRPYYVDRLYFAEDAGLFFMIETIDKDMLDKVQAALKLLGDNGLGTDRNIGNGYFEPKLEELNLKLPSNTNFQTNLSLYCPESKDSLRTSLENEKTSYNLIKRGGWMASPEDEKHISLRKKSVFMFQEGSIFPKQAENLKGKIANLKPENKKLKDMQIEIQHPIYRDGQAVFLPINIE